MKVSGGNNFLSFNIDQRESLLSFLRNWFNLNFEGYYSESLHRRLDKVMNDFRASDVDELILGLKHHPEGRDHFLDSFTVNVTDFFREPHCFMALKSTVLPLLEKKEKVNIWVAGCSTGEEVLSLCILLHEFGILERTQITATDISGKAITRARRGAFATDFKEEHQKQYLDAGGRQSFSDYLDESGCSNALGRALTREVEWQTHDLINDPVPGRFDLILCRYVLIYFKPHLQKKLLHSLVKSLHSGGFFMQGFQESLILYLENQIFQEVDPGSSIYQKRT